MESPLEVAKVQALLFLAHDGGGCGLPTAIPPHHCSQSICQSLPRPHSQAQLPLTKALSILDTVFFFCFLSSATSPLLTPVVYFFSHPQVLRRGHPSAQ